MTAKTLEAQLLDATVQRDELLHALIAMADEMADTCLSSYAMHDISREEAEKQWAEADPGSWDLYVQARTAIDKAMEK